MFIRKGAQAHPVACTFVFRVEAGTDANPVLPDTVFTGLRDDIAKAVVCAAAAGHVAVHIALGSGAEDNLLQGGNPGDTDIDNAP